MRPYRFHPAAVEEAEAAAEFYEGRREGLGGRFVASLREAIDRIRMNPSIYRQVEEGARKCRVMRFPYGVIFRERDGTIEVLAVMNLRRDPSYWRGR